MFSSYVCYAHVHARSLTFKIEKKNIFFGRLTTTNKIENENIKVGDDIEERNRESKAL